MTLKDTGLRDEYGLEPMDGIFSSPEKSPVKMNGMNHQSTIQEEEDMVLGESMSRAAQYSHTRVQHLADSLTHRYNPRTHRNSSISSEW